MWPGRDCGPLGFGKKNDEMDSFKQRPRGLNRKECHSQVGMWAPGRPSRLTAGQVPAPALSPQCAPGQEKPKPAVTAGRGSEASSAVGMHFPSESFPHSEKIF